MENLNFAQKEYKESPERKKAILDLEETWVKEWVDERADDFSTNIGKELENPGWFDSFIENELKNNSKKEAKKIFEKELTELKHAKIWLEKGIDLFTNNLLDFKDTLDVDLNEELKGKLKLYISNLQQGIKKIEEIEEKFQKKLKDLRD